MAIPDWSCDTCPYVDCHAIWLSTLNHMKPRNKVFSLPIFARLTTRVLEFSIGIQLVCPPTTPRFTTHVLLAVM